MYKDKFEKQNENLILFIGLNIGSILGITFGLFFSGKVLFLMVGLNIISVILVIISVIVYLHKLYNK